eukprot:gene13945-15396_t
MYHRPRVFPRPGAMRRIFICLQRYADLEYVVKVGYGFAEELAALRYVLAAQHPHSNGRGIRNHNIAVFSHVHCYRVTGQRRRRRTR